MPGFTRAVIERARTRPARESIPYTLGRFDTVRRVYGGFLGALQHVGAVPGVKSASSDPMPLPDVADLVAALHGDSAWIGLSMRPEHVNEIVCACRTATLRQWRTGRLFRMEEVVRGRLRGGMPVVIADVLGIDSVAAARAVAEAPTILQAFELYTGYRPIGFELRVLASFADDVSDETRRFYGQTIDFHFDVHSYNFIYANYYLSPVDATSGAHVMVLGSHADKPASWLIGSARRSDSEITERYGSERVRVIEGGPGFGFLQDSSCYHKALAPTAADRLMLHVRYY